MYHYVYLLEFENGMGYVGMHSTVIEPELDTRYLGSGTALPPKDSIGCTKTILKTFSSREEAVQYEIDIIDLNDCVASPIWYNQRRSTHDKHGSSLSLEHRELIRETMIGRKRPEFAAKYVGEGRTPAQRAGSIRAGEKIRGTKNPDKGFPSISNTAFVPWYFYTPDGVYTEVHDITKKDYAAILGCTHRQLTHRFHHTNIHKAGTTKPFKDWVFGNLPAPTDMGKN